MATPPRRHRYPYNTYATRHAHGLRRREDEIWKMVAFGSTDQQIADDLGIARATVENHVTAILERLPVGQPRMCRRLRAALLYHGIAFRDDGN